MEEIISPLAAARAEAQAWQAARARRTREATGPDAAATGGQQRHQVFDLSGLDPVGRADEAAEQPPAKRAKTGSMPWWDSTYTKDLKGIINQSCHGCRNPKRKSIGE
jgi:hypothetical protein